MPLYISDIPYMKTEPKRVALPKSGKSGNDINKLGYGNLAFLFTENVSDSIRIINNKINCFNDNKYKYYYYNLLYRGNIGPRRYNIKNVDKRKSIYERITNETSLTPHPPSLLNKTPNRNTYFELCEYFNIYKTITKSFTPTRKMTLFWAFFKSVMMSEQTSGYDKKFVIIDCDLYGKFSGSAKECIDNPLFMLYYTLYKNLELVKDMNIDFYIYCKTSILKINPSLCDEKSYIIFKSQLTRLLAKTSYGVNLNILDEKNIDVEDQKENIKEKLIAKYNFTGNNKKDEDELTSCDEDTSKSEEPSKEEDIIKQKIDNKVDAKIDDVKTVISNVVPEENIPTPEVSELITTQTEMELDEDKELINDMYNVIKAKKVPSTPVSSARDKQLRQRQENIKINNLTIKAITDEKKNNRPIPEKRIANNIKSSNENVKTVKFVNINKDYIENVMQSDIIKSFTALNNKDNKFYVKDVKIKDTSNELVYKDTYTVVLEDEKHVRHTINVDIPKFLDNKFLYVGGNKKIIDRQNFLYPVVKTAPDTVQIVTNYNKVFLRRTGSRSIGSVQRLMKLITSNEDCLKYFTTGDNSSINHHYLTTLEYDEFGKIITKFENDTTLLFFNQVDAMDYCEKHAITVPENNLFLGVYDKENIFVDVDKQLTSMDLSISDLIVSKLPENLQKEYGKIKSAKRVMYSTATLMSQTVPVMVLLMYWEGITSLFKKMNLKYEYSKSRPSSVKGSQGVLQFKDCYIIYNEDVATSLLMNGLKVLDTEHYNMDDYNTINPFIQYFKKVYGKVAIINSLTNYYEFLIDPITLEVLKDINLPTDVIELFLYANNLLSDDSYTRENSQTLSRIRSIEIIPAILYNELSQAYLAYKNSMGKVKLSINKDSVIKQLLALQTVEDYSTLNPTVELEKDRAVTSKGFRGINVDRAYTEEKRSYDSTMLGVMGMSTSPDGNVGINRFLTLEPNITSARGYVDIKDKKQNELKDVNLFIPSELLYPLGNTRDDPVRIAMSGKQSKHVIPIKKSAPALMSNGVDESIKYSLSSDFVIIAEEDGTIVDYDPKSNILMAEYKSGKRRAISLSPCIVKNGGGGFYLSNELITKYKVGDKFKKDDTLAWHKEFFKDDGHNGIRMNVGVLEKVAITSNYNTYNDSIAITKKLSDDAESNMTFCKSVVVGKNSNIYDIRKIGDEVSIGDPLISFDTSFQDNELNKLLSNLSSEDKEVLDQGSSNIVKSKYAGHIIDIKIYSTVELEEMSESLRGVVKKYYARVNNKTKFVSKYDNNPSIVKCGLLLNETTGKIEPNAYNIIRGEKVDNAVLIEFYIEHGDIMGVGDKLTFFTALKGVIGQIIPEGYEPYSEFRPDEEVSSFIAPSSILKRQTPSIILTMFGNKVIVELKRKLKEIYES